MTAAATPAAAPIDSVSGVFLQFGVLGALALLGLAGAVAVWRAQERRQATTEERLDKVQAEKDDLMREALPVLTRAVEVMSDVVAEMRRERRS